MRPGVKGAFTATPAFFVASSTAAQPPRTIRSASETFLPFGLLLDCEALNSFWIASSRLSWRRFCASSKRSKRNSMLTLGLRSIEFLLDRFELAQNLRQLSRLVDVP